MSKIGREKTGLLDDLWKKTGCLYLSDLKQPAWRGCLLFCHKRDSGGRVHALGMERRSKIFK